MANRDIDTITTELHKSYRKWKDGEKDKNKYKNEFFEWVEESGVEPKTEVVEIETDSEDKLKEIVEKEYPAFVIDTISKEDNYYSVLLKENLKYIGYKYTNTELGISFEKQVVRGSLMLDDELLKEEDPELYEEISFVPEPVRRLKSMDDLTEDQLNKINKYMYESKPSVKFPAPKKAKEEDLND